MTRSFYARLAHGSAWAAAAFAFALTASGCGGGDNGGASGAPAEDQEIVAAVSEKISAAAGRIANSTTDRNLPGPYTFKVVCLSPEDARQHGTPRDSVQCHVEAFSPRNAYVWSEDWRVPVQDGKLGTPEIVGEYRIKNFLRRDNRLNCSGGETPQERCTGVYKSPSEQSGIPGGGTPVPQGQPVPVPASP